MEPNRNPKAILFTVILVLAAGIKILFLNTAGKDRRVTYSLYPYLPDVEYYTEILEEEWEKLHPDVGLEYVPYDCYFDGRPEGIDVIMYDTILEREFIEKGYLKPLKIGDIINAEDYFGFTLEPAAGCGDHYGVPVFLCCDLLIYDRESEVLAEANDIFDVAGPDNKLLISFASYGDDIYLLDAAADIGEGRGCSIPDVSRKILLRGNGKRIPDVWHAEGNRGE